MRLKGRFESIFIQGKIIEDPTTSFILFQTYYNNLDTVSFEILQYCKLTDKDSCLLWNSLTVKS